MLEVLLTDIWATFQLPRSLNRSKLTRSFLARQSPLIPRDKVGHFTAGALWHAGWQRLASSVRSRSPFEHYYEYGKWFACKVVDFLKKDVLLQEGLWFHGFTTGSLETIMFLRELGIQSILQQIDASRVHYDILEQEARLWPGWESSLHSVPSCYYKRSEEEWEFASVIVVNSEWSANSLVQLGVAPDKIRIVPLFYRCSKDGYQRPRPTSRRLRVLWSGTVNLGKGIQYLVEAAKRPPLRNVDFLIAGAVQLTPEAVRTAPANMAFLGRLARPDMEQLFCKCDVLVFPTLSDGFGLVQLEAMARGLPVITTPNCGKVVSHGQDGFIVPARNAEQLSEAVRILNEDRDLLARMSEAAKSKVQEYGLERYPGVFQEIAGQGKPQLHCGDTSKGQEIVGSRHISSMRTR